MIKLIMLPYAGNMVEAYKEWKVYSDEWLEVINIDYNGRGFRSCNPEPRNWEELIRTTFEQIVEVVNESDEYVLLGHSMGAKVAMDLYLLIKSERHKLPMYIIFSGTTVFKNDEKNLLDLQPSEFEKYFLDMGGIDKEILDYPELKNMVFEYLRKDIMLLGGFNTERKFCIEHSRAVIINGDLEKQSSIEEWEKILGSIFIYKVFSGNHFFILEKKNEVFEFIFNIIMENDLEQQIRQSQCIVASCQNQVLGASKTNNDV